MIKLSSLLEHILDHPMKGEAILEAKRLEANESGPSVCLEFTHEYEVTEGESVLWVIEITRDSDPFDSFGTIEFNDREEAKKALSMLRAACPEHHVSLFYSLDEGITDHPDIDVSNTELKPQRKPLVDEDGYKVYIIVDERGCCADWQLTRRDAENDARDRTEDTCKPHTVCQVMAPESGECPTVPVVTFTPEREHEWIIFNPDFVHDGTCWAEQSKYGDILWNNVPYDADTIRFPSAAKAQAYITTHNITNAFPWAIPKLSEK